MGAKRSIVTICGSYRFTDLMYKCYRQLTEKGYAVFMPAIGCDEHDHAWYRDLHFSKISMSDLVFVVDGDEGYVGEATKEEIDFAEHEGKTIIRYSEIEKE